MNAPFDNKLAAAENALAVQQSEQIAALESKLARAMSEYDRMNAALQRDPSGQDWLAMRDCLRESEKQLADCRASLAEACDIADNALLSTPYSFHHRDQRDRVSALRKAGGL